MPKASQQSISAEIGAWALKVHPIVSEAEFVASYQRDSRTSSGRVPPTNAPPSMPTMALCAYGMASSDVPLALAVASSCALPGVFAPVTIGGHRYMDGGVRSVTNADLARGCKTAVSSRPPWVWLTRWRRASPARSTVNCELLRSSGCKVELIAPDARQSQGIRRHQSETSTIARRRSMRAASKPATSPPRLPSSGAIESYESAVIARRWT